MQKPHAASVDAVRVRVVPAVPLGASCRAVPAGASAALRRASKLFTGALLVAMSGACVPGGAASDDEVTYGTMPRLGLTQGTTFCARRDDDGCQFVDIHVAAVGPDGRVALAGAYGEVIQFDRAGRFVRRLGRVGSGPGEYRSAMAISYDSAATLRLFDVVTRRLVSLDSAGRPLVVLRTDFPPPMQHAAFVGDQLVFAVLAGAAKIGDSVEARFVAMDSTGAPTLPIGRAPAVASSTGDGSLMPMLAPFAPRTQWGIARNGALYFADGAALRVVRADGAAPRTIVDMVVAPPPVTAAELDSARELLLRPPRGRMPSAMVQGTRQAAEAALANAAKVHPMIGVLAVLDDGTLWARETLAAAPDSIRWNGFQGDGRPLGYILLPVRARILAGDRDRLLIVTHDAEDAASAAWWRVER